MRSSFLAIVLLLVSAAPAAAFCRMRAEELGSAAGGDCSEGGHVLAWRRSCLSYSVVPRERGGLELEDIRDAIARGFEAWRKVECDGQPVPLVLAQTEQLSHCDEPQHNASRPNVNSVMFVSDWKEQELPDAAFGLTLVWHDPKSGEIYDADMQINETMGELAVCGAKCESGQVDIQNVVTHEAGHFLGLDHSDDRTASMYAEAFTGEVTKRVLGEDDIAGLCDAYGGGEVPRCTASDFAPRNGFTTHCIEQESSEGCTVARPGRNAAPGLLVAFGVMTGLLLRRRLR